MFAPSQEMLFASRKSIAIEQQEIPVLNDRDNVLYLAYHGAKHGWCRLGWLTPFLGLLDARKADLDMEALAREIQANGLADAVGSALVIARDCLKRPIEVPQLSAFAEREESVEFARWCVQRSFDCTDAVDVDAGELLAFSASLVEAGQGGGASRRLGILTRRQLLGENMRFSTAEALYVHKTLGGSRLRYLAMRAASPKDRRLRAAMIPVRFVWRRWQSWRARADHLEQAGPRPGQT